MIPFEIFNQLKFVGVYIDSFSNFQYIYRYKHSTSLDVYIPYTTINIYVSCMHTINDDQHPAVDTGLYRGQAPQKMIHVHPVWLA